MKLNVFWEEYQMANVEKIAKKGSLLTYRKDIKVVDCTLRDGGLMNNFNFTDEFAKGVYDTCVNAGIDYMEFGYKSSKNIYSTEEFGKWKFCDEADIRSIVGENATNLKISVMADVGRTDYATDILPREDSVIDMIRVATYIHQIPSAVELIQDAHAKGYETTVNLMAVSIVQEHELDEALAILAATDVDIIYLADSFGALYPEETRALTTKYLEIAEANGKSIGMHAHNNQQMAFSNTIETLTLGASYLDSSLAGLGRGAGNCHTELLLEFLKNPKYNLRPVLKFLEEQILPLRKTVKWGYDIPYMLTGQLNRHPKPAMDYIDKDQTNYVEFYDMLNES